jgi:hypothetical protein
MALKFEVDTLEGVEESHKGFYTEHNGKYRLSVEGLDPADEVKGALAKEREERKRAKAEADELRKALEGKELTELESQKKYEELYKKAQETSGKTAAELTALQNKIADRDKSEAARKVAASLTRDTAKAALLQKEIMGLTRHSESGVSFEGDSGVMTAEQVAAHITKQYPFLVDGNQSSGGGAAGGNGGGAAKGNLGGDKTERKNAISAMFPELK